MTQLSKFIELLSVYDGTTAYSIGGGYIEDSRVESDVVTRVSISDEDVPAGSFVSGSRDDTLLDFVPQLSAYTDLSLSQLKSGLSKYIATKSSFGRNPKQSFVVLSVLNSIVLDMESEPAIVAAFGWEE